ncbi:hypothetical protein CYMTET_23523, partial [Cymbomonas tetramitiformis]
LWGEMHRLRGERDLKPGRDGRFVNLGEGRGEEWGQAWRQAAYSRQKAKQRLLTELLAKDAAREAYEEKMREVKQANLELSFRRTAFELEQAKVEALEPQMIVRHDNRTALLVALQLQREEELRQAELAEDAAYTSYASETRKVHEFRIKENALEVDRQKSAERMKVETAEKERERKEQAVRDKERLRQEAAELKAMEGQILLEGKLKELERHQEELHKEENAQIKSFHEKHQQLMLVHEDLGKARERAEQVVEEMVHEQQDFETARAAREQREIRKMERAKQREREGRAQRVQEREDRKSGLSGSGFGRIGAGKLGGVGSSRAGGKVFPDDVDS